MRDVRSHTIESTYQAGRTRIHVLLPKALHAGCCYPVVYLLPVEAENGCQYGSGLREAQIQDLHNRFRVLCACPTFSHLPWYADHPTDTTIRQESHLLRVVVPFVERNYPAMPCTAGRFLVGFSKSGWGAFSLVLRHPRVFQRAAAWDAPLDMHHPDRYGMREIFGTQEQFEKYRISSLIRRNADMLRDGARLALVGHANFHEHHRAIHGLLNSLGIRHAYQAGPPRKHAWDSGWLPDAFHAAIRGSLCRQ